MKYLVEMKYQSSSFLKLFNTIKEAEKYCYKHLIHTTIEEGLKEFIKSVSDDIYVFDVAENGHINKKSLSLKVSSECSFKKLSNNSINLVIDALDYYHRNAVMCPALGVKNVILHNEVLEVVEEMRELLK